MHLNPVISLFFFVLSYYYADANAEAYRLFTDQNNRTIEARFNKFNGDYVQIVRRDGRSFRVKPSAFSYDDQKYFADLKEKINPKTNRLWTADDFKGLLLRDKWTCQIKSGAHKHIIEFSLDKIDIDKDDIPDGRKIVHHTSFVNKKRLSSFGWWKVNAEGIIETSIGTWEYDKKGNLLTGKCKSCYSSCCSVLRPFVKQLEQK